MKKQKDELKSEKKQEMSIINKKIAEKPKLMAKKVEDDRAWCSYFLLLKEFVIW